MNNLKKALQGLNLQKLVEFFGSNADTLHRSQYHHEGFDTHCLLMIGSIFAEYEAGRASKEAVVAACLHDIAKPRTADLNEKGEACFYSHENVTDKELAEFLEPDYPEFNRVAAMVRGHMLPYLLAEQPSPKLWKQHNTLLEQFGGKFMQDLQILHECDDRSCIRNDADLPAAEKEAEAVKSLLLQIAQ